MTRHHPTKLSGILFVSLFSFVSASPLIEVEKETYDCGIFIEGKNEKTTAIYNIKNSGDSILKIEKVRTGCGCVAAAYDTIIPPGKSGQIKLETRLNGYTGVFKKSATIISNAKNQPNLRITLTATIQPVIAVSQGYITLPTSKDRKPVNLFLSSLKKDLSITGINFKPNDNSSSEWQSQLSLPINYEWSKTDSISPDGFTVYSLSINGIDLKSSDYGEFIISTNHPDKQEIRISGRIE